MTLWFSKILICVRRLFGSSARAGDYIPAHQNQPPVSKKVRVVGRTARDGRSAPKPEGIRR